MRAAAGIGLAAMTILSTGVGSASARPAIVRDPISTLETECDLYVPAPTPDNYSQCREADLRALDLSGIDLSYADLTDSAMFGVTLNGTNLTGAKLTTYLTNSNLNGANFTDVDLTGVDFYRTTVMPPDVYLAAESPSGSVAAWTIPTPPRGLRFGTCDHESGSMFPAGETTAVLCTIHSTTNESVSSSAFSIFVAPAFIDTEPVELTATLGAAFERIFPTVNNIPYGSPPSVDPSALPPGLTFKDSRLSGTPTTPGTYTFTMTAWNDAAKSTLDVTMIVTGEITPHTTTPAPPASRGSINLSDFDFGS